MILQGLIDFFYTIAQYVISLLPDVTAQDEQNIASIVNALNTFRDYVASANFWFPIDTLILIFQLIILDLILTVTFLLVRFVAHTLSFGTVK